MKQRNGFVSNSSSTCFLIHVNDDERKFLHYNYRVTNEKYLYMDNEYAEEREKILLRAGYKLVEQDNKYRTYVYDSPILRGNQDVGRSTVIAFGKVLLDMVEQWRNCEYVAHYAEQIANFIQCYGLDNVLFLRESDEGAGGYLPTELVEFTKLAELQFEYH